MKQVLKESLQAAAIFLQSVPEHWFVKSAEFDSLFHSRFLASHEAAARGYFDDVFDSGLSALGLIILLDQFPRNAFRGTARMFQTDEKAREIADISINAGYDQQVEPTLRVFFYLPFEHSERIEDQIRCVELTRSLDPSYLQYAEQHRDIILRFGRFPHRNAILLRESTPDEVAFLQQGGFGG